VTCHQQPRSSEVPLSLIALPDLLWQLSPRLQGRACGAPTAWPRPGSTRCPSVWGHTRGPLPPHRYPHPATGPAPGRHAPGGRAC